MLPTTTDPIAIEFFDGSILRYETHGNSGRVVLLAASGREDAGLKTNAKAAFADFLRRAQRIARTTDPIDQALFDRIVLQRDENEADWDQVRYLATIRDGGWTAFLVPRGLVAYEKIGYRLVDEKHPEHEIRTLLAEDLKQIGGDITLIGAYADRERFVLLDGFLAEHDETSTTEERLADLREVLGDVPSIVFAPQQPAETSTFVPTETIDIIVRRLDDPYSSMPQHSFESRFARSTDPDYVSTSVQRDPNSPFVSPPREGLSPT